MRITAAIILLIVSLGVVGCDGPHPSVVTSPSIATTPIATTTIAGATQVSGYVYDTAFRYLDRVRVEVLDGPQAGQSTLSTSTGQFSLTGVFDDTTRFRATKDGYFSATATWGAFCAACNPHRWMYFTLPVPAPSANIAGSYDLTFVADSGCRDLPDALRTRTYAATIAPASSTGDPQGTSLFVVTIGNVPFLNSYKSFRIGVAGDYLGFPDNDGATLVEEIASNTYLSYNAFGWAGNQIVGASAGSTITTTIASVDYCVMKAPFAGSAYFCAPGSALAHVECLGNNRLILSRR